MIHAMVPFRRDRNLGLACNEAMANVPDGQWGCLLDHDMMFTTPHWHAQLEESILAKPDAGAFAVVTNRIASEWQRAGDQNINDIAWHRQFGEQRRQIRTLLDISETKGFGGVVTLLNKAAWVEAGGYADGMYCADHSIFFRMTARGRRVYLIEGLYVFHMRASSGARPPLDAPKVPNCPCRGPEKLPTKRLTLP